MGEIGEVLGRALARALGKTLSENPVFRQYEWQIFACVIGLPIFWMALKEWKPLWTALKGDWASLRTDRHQKPAGPRRSELRDNFRDFWRALREGSSKASITAPVGLRIPLAISVVALTIAVIGDMPYDFFVLLRVLIFVTCVACLTALRKAGRQSTIWLWVIVTAAVVYNPLLPIHLHRETWEWMNIATIPVFCVLAVLIKGTQRTA
jgi:hypothetical protein